MKWSEVIEEVAKELVTKPTKKWVKVVVMIITICIMAWLSVSCATWYVHRSIARSNSDSIVFETEFSNRIEKK